MIYKNYIKRKLKKTKDTESNKTEAVHPTNKEKQRIDSLLKLPVLYRRTNGKKTSKCSTKQGMKTTKAILQKYYFESSKPGKST